MEQAPQPVGGSVAQFAAGHGFGVGVEDHRLAADGLRSSFQHALQPLDQTRGQGRRRDGRQPTPGEGRAGCIGGGAGQGRQIGLSTLFRHPGGQKRPILDRVDPDELDAPVGRQRLVQRPYAAHLGLERRVAPLRAALGPEVEDAVQNGLLAGLQILVQPGALDRIDLGDIVPQADAPIQMRQQFQIQHLGRGDAVALAEQIQPVVIKGGREVEG